MQADFSFPPIKKMVLDCQTLEELDSKQDQRIKKLNKRIFKTIPHSTGYWNRIKNSFKMSQLCFPIISVKDFLKEKDKLPNYFYPIFQNERLHLSLIEVTDSKIIKSIEKNYNRSAYKSPIVGGDGFNRTIEVFGRFSFFTAQDREYQELRHFVMRYFHTITNDGSLLKILHSQATQWIEILSSKKSNSAVNLIPLTTKFASQLIQDILFGEEIGTISAASVHLSDRVQKLFSFSHLILTLTDSKEPSEEACKLIQEVVTNICDNSQNYSGLIRKIYEENPTTELADSKEKMAGITKFLLVAAYDKLSISLATAIYCLGKHSECQRILHDKIKSYSKKITDLTLKDLKDFPELDWFVKETLRLYPPIPTQVRKTAQSTEVDDYLLPANHYIILHRYLAQCNGRYWQKPEEFDPERFKFNGEELKGTDYYPFGAPPYNHCLGQNLALYTIKFFLIKAISQLEFSHVEDVEFEFGLNLKALSPIQSSIKLRQN